MNLARLKTIGRGLAYHTLARLTGKSAWSAVTILLTLRCNLRCAYCDFPRHEGPERDTRYWLDLLRRLSKIGTVRLGLSGGEPLLRTDLGELVSAARRLGLITSLVTNGVLLADRVRDVSLVDYLLVTIEGNRSVHDAVRGAGTWDAALNGLAAFRHTSRARTGLICPVHAGNVASLEEVLSLAEDLRLPVFFQPVQQRTGWRGPRFHGFLTSPEVRAAFAWLLRAHASGRPVGNSARYLDFVARGAEGEIAGKCSAGRFFVTILPDGRPTPCCMLPFPEDCTPIEPEQLDKTPYMPTPSCRGCSIGPYIETHLLLSVDPSAWWSALRWSM